MSDYAFAPVLLIFFNRPETLREVFAEVRKAKPPILYLAQDGARENNTEDIIRIQECRTIVENIDWNCQIYKLYSDVNQGCGLGPRNAINWLFENEDRGIILEDDCVPSQSFFRFCSEMLEYYKEDERVFLITGSNLEIRTRDISESYFFGYSATNWGWATWRRNWKDMDYECNFTQNTIISENLKDMMNKVQYGSKGIAEFNSFSTIFNRLRAGENISMWDVQWQALKYLKHQLAIIPVCNLITNIGYGPTATHGKNNIIPKKLYSTPGEVHFAYNQKTEMVFPLIHPQFMLRHARYDYSVDKTLWPCAWKRYLNKVLNKLRRVLQ